jgi:hypothetical protein
MPAPEEVTRINVGKETKKESIIRINVGEQGPKIGKKLDNQQK